MFRIPRRDRVFKLILDLAVLSVSYCLAFGIRFEGSIPTSLVETMILSLPYVILVQFIYLLACNVPRLTWRYIGILEARRIFMALLIASATIAIGNWGWDLFKGDIGPLHDGRIPRGVFLIDLGLSLLGMIGLRVGVRLWYERIGKRLPGPARRAKMPTILIGAGSAGAVMVKEIQAHADLGIQPIGFLDDNANDTGMEIHGIRVLGTLADLGRIVKDHGARQALITLGSPTGEHVRRILNLCDKAGISTKIVPGIHDIVEGRIGLSSIRDVALEDILPREAVSLDSEAISAIVNSRPIMITGAGGSIGSELCDTVCRYGPATLLLVEQAENSLFQVHRHLANEFPRIDIVPCLADVCDSARMKQLFATYRPDVVLHAAAHKHVPLMEYNPGEAIKNNVMGTRNLVDLAHEFGVSEFVMISTDKAVNPTSIMGVSKRIAEIYVQAMTSRSPTRFVTVRFGNVLGSNGSVIPIFKEQIARGGPVTVTHPEMKRYFMTIPEACQLVMQAASMGKGGEIFILDMGEPVKIVDVARDLIRLSGLAPDDIEIKFIGIRPGEKLYEELSLKEEIAQKTEHAKVFIGRLVACGWAEINQQIDELQEWVDGSDICLILEKLKEIVPEYVHGNQFCLNRRNGVATDARHHLNGSNGVAVEPAHGLPGAKTNGHAPKRQQRDSDRRVHNDRRQQAVPVASERRSGSERRRQAERLEQVEPAPCDCKSARGVNAGRV